MMKKGKGGRVWGKGGGIYSVRKEGSDLAKMLEIVHGLPAELNVLLKVRIT